MSENRVAPASMALTIRVLLALPEQIRGTLEVLADPSIVFALRSHVASS